FSRDWSSDVCSSDLAHLAEAVVSLRIAADAPRRLFGDGGLRNQIARRGVPSRERDPGFLADPAATPVAPHEIPRSKRAAVGKLDVDAALVLREARHFAPAKDGHRELGDPVGEDLLDAVLREREPIVVASRKIADIERDLRERR